MLKRTSRLVLSSLRYASDLILPAVCVSCSATLTRHNLLCPRCWSDLHLITPPLCNRLGIPLPGYEGDGPHISMQAMANPPAFARARAAAHYTGIIRRLIVRFKFEDKHEPVPLFLKLMREAGKDLIAGADVLVPVPLHRLRLLQRRFNQSALLAQGLGNAAGVPARVTALKRTKRTRAQVGLSEDERHRNVAGAFAVTPSGRLAIAGKAVLLIDDVMTTGATVNSCAKALLGAGASRVDVLALALVAHGFETLGGGDFDSMPH
jgi:ComF family protein